ncbi:DNA repair protein complementing XP-C cells homolog isoform X3 [Bradysia coprophila]|uniref:DNA repair protein complementing XP-C cells homolog isoform X3 n=1 Tax=Bradysia coprophila TaxID=38358 RepID=UPI00187D9849|nr:DNA repair protein complementing XP-C cells homolog isoform X3 [Bradysia coprophila]
MSDTESENESDLDFSASEDEYVPSEDADSESDDYRDQTFIEEPTSSKRIKKGKPNSATRKDTEDDDDSDSSVENYLVNPNEIDLSSDFFDPNKKVVLDAPKFDCNVGLKLSDSEEEVFEAVPSTSRELYNFSPLKNAQEQMKKVIQDLENFQANNYGLGNAMKYLAMGEPLLATKKSSQPKHKDISNSSDESDFEEVEEGKEAVKKSDVEVRIGPADKQKTNKLQADIEASIKRKINRRKKESQLMMHKVHLLSWIAYGNYVNKVLNSTKLMEMVVKYIPSEKCYPKDKTDQQFFEQISKWFKTTVGLKSKEQNCPLKCLPPIATSLALQIQSKMAICKKDFVFIFIILLRSIGIQCRLVINLGTVPMRPAAKDLCVISTKPTEKSSSKDKAKKDKKSTKADKISSQDKKTRKDSTTSKSKVKSRTNSISGAMSEILMKSPEHSDQKKKTEHDKRKNLKRSVSVQSSSSVNDNAKRSRIKSTSSSKELQNGTKRSTSVQKPTSTTRKASKLSLNKQESVQSTEAPVALNSPISHHTRMGVARRSSVAGSPTIPQLDGGDDKKKKKSKSNLYKIRLPLRARSVSSPSLNATSIALVTPPRGRTKSITPSLRLPSMSRSKSKSPDVTSEHASRKSQFEKSNDSSSLSAESSSKLETSSIEENPTTTKRGRRTLYTSPTKPWRHFDQTTSKANINEKSTSEAELQLNAETQQIKAESSIQTTAEATTPLKQSLNPDEKLTSTTNDTKSASKDSTIPPIKSAASKSSKSKTKSSDPGKKLRSTSIEPTSTSTTATASPTKSAASSKRSNSKTKSSDTGKKLRSTSVEPASTSTSATELQSKSTTSSKSSKSKTKSSNPGKKLRSTSIEPTSTSTTATASPTKSAALSKRSNSKTKSAATSSSAVSSTSKESESKPVKSALKRKATISVSSDSDFAPTPKKKLSPSVDKPLPKQVERLKKRIDRRILSTDDESVEPTVKKDDMNYWIEVYCEAESKWICIDLFKMKVNCVDEVKKKATKPIAYVFAWNNNNKIKDVTPRYCSQWNTTTRKLRVQPDWLDEALSRYREPLSQRCVAEDRELEEIHAQTPIPSSIAELKNHPLYVLPRHLLKFEGIYPPNPVPVGFIRDEPIYSRLCVHTLHSREIWVKQARVVKPGEIPYKIVKARPKWDRLSNKMLEPLPLEIFGRWQTGPYIPPTAENGIVPRNAYGNVELFKPEMLPKKTVHLRLAGLNRVCAKLKIDCAQAVVGFDFHGGSSHPTFDGFVVCEEFAELVTERWCEEQEESHRKAQEKQKQRVYDNWKKLIKGLLIRERLQRKYNFAGKDEPKGK